MGPSGGRARTIFIATSMACVMEALKQRALQFLQQAEFAKERGFHELALFDVEQCAQLYMKYLTV